MAVLLSKITITQTDGQTTGFNAYQIFTAAVTEDQGTTDGKKVSDLQWAKGAEAVVEGVAGHPFKTAQDGADWIKNHIQNTGKTTAVEATSDAYKLAKAFQDSTLNSISVTPGIEKDLSDGYWLFVTNEATLHEGEVATSPIFAVVGGSPVTVAEKDSLPTVKKTVNGKTADSVGVDDTVSYHLTGTVASNIDTYSKYYYKFTDTLSAGLDYVAGSVAVKVGGTEVSENENTYSVEYNKDTHTLTVTFKDLKGIGVNITKDTQVTVDYRATVNTAAKAGTSNNLSNSAMLTYSNNPKTADQGEPDGTTHTPASQTRSYTYKLNLIKLDRDTEEPLSGAVFTLKDKDGNFIKADGTKTKTESEAHLSGSSITVNGLDEGDYTLHEVTAPDGYDTTADVTIHIKPTIAGDDGQTLTALKNTVEGNDDAIAGVSDNTPGDHKLTAKANTASDFTNGTITVTVGDKKEITMPLTGMKGTTALMVYGSAILVISAAAYLKHKKSQSEGNA
ncbi:MAG: isopeptide-forming domain-containing fimbrial protein [Olsenella sp.]|nr:isopeptide-forming domain-containing fimbrial protein [Olsenella sp.]